MICIDFPNGIHTSIGPLVGHGGSSSRSSWSPDMGVFFAPKRRHGWRMGDVGETENGGFRHEHVDLNSRNGYEWGNHQGKLGDSRSA